MGLLFGWRGRVRRWPKVEDGLLPWGVGAVPDIKVISIDVLERLMDKAARTPGVSATGCPEWLDKHRDDIGHHYVVVCGPEGGDFYRCIVFSVLGDRPAGAYTLDVRRADFHALPAIAPAQLVELAHQQLSNTPMVPLDPSQEESWRVTGESDQP